MIAATTRERKGCSGFGCASQHGNNNYEMVMRYNPGG